MASSYPVCLQSGILVFILMKTCRGISIQQMLFNEFTLGYIVLTVYVPCLLIFLLNYTVLLCYPYWIIVMKYGDLHPCNILNIWRGFIQSLIVHHLALIFQCVWLWQNKDSFMQQYKCIECYISYHHHIWMTHFIMLLTKTSHTGQNLYCLFVPRVQTTLAKHSFYFWGTQIWNSLNPILYTRKLEQFKSVYQSQNRLFMYVVSEA